MSFFDKFKKREDNSEKEDKQKKEAEADKSKKDTAWATSKERSIEETSEKCTENDKKDRVVKPMAEKKADNKVWHITKRETDGMWQVKAEGASRATKLFKTKAEAENYVKTLRSNNEGSRVVKHKKTGEFQKK